MKTVHVSQRLAEKGCKHVDMLTEFLTNHLKTIGKVQKLGGGSN